MTGTRGVADSIVRTDVERLRLSRPDRKEPADEAREFLVLCGFTGSTLTSENMSMSNLSASALVRR